MWLAATLPHVGSAAGSGSLDSATVSSAAIGAATAAAGTEGAAPPAGAATGIAAGGAVEAAADMAALRTAERQLALSRALPDGKERASAASADQVVACLHTVLMAYEYTLLLSMEERERTQTRTVS